MGKNFKLVEPIGNDLPDNGFSFDHEGYKAPAKDGSVIEVKDKSKFR